jgi:hypothetical protein
MSKNNLIVYTGSVLICTNNNKNDKNNWEKCNYQLNYR